MAKRGGFGLSLVMRFQLGLWVVLMSCARVAAVVVDEPVVPSNAAAPPADDEVAGAFDSAPARPAKRPVATPVMADARKPFKDAMNARAAQLACQHADSLTGLERWKAYELAFTVAEGDSAKGEAALVWHQACGPEKLEPCRAAALAALGRLKPFAKRAARLKAGDVCVTQAEARQKPAPCTTSVERDDEVNQTRVALLKALAEPVENRRAALLEKVVSGCERVQCATARRKALAALVAIDQAGKHLEAALGHSFRDIAIAAATLPEAERPWVRSAKVDQLCAQFDATAGAGSCRKLERQRNGGWTFHDFSTSKSATSGLTADQVKLVGAHYAPPLQECLGEQARRLVPPDQAEYEVRWVVVNDGRVGEVHLQPSLEASPFATCLRRQFSLWRYPRFEGEWQNVAQRFTVTAVTRVQVSEQF